MARHNLLGVRGEEAAARFLMFRDYSILEQNWRVDIIAQKRGLLIFVEVKTLADTNVILPEEHVDEEKREHLIKAAEAYLKIKNLDQQVRFDIISVTGSEPPYEIRHIENAFEVPPTFVGR